MSSVVAQWLDRVLVPYGPARDRLRSECLEALARHPTLAVKTDAYTHDSGHTQLLLVLHGTLPVAYRSQTYHFPCALWFPLEYPRQPPIVYVTPTAEMAVRKGAHVEPSGRVVGGYLEGWARKPEAHALPGLVEWLREVWAREPPVYARASRPVAAQPQPPARPAATTEPLPAYGAASPPPPPLSRPQPRSPPPPPLPASPLRSRGTPPPPPIPVHSHPPPLARPSPRPPARDLLSSDETAAAAAPIPTNSSEAPLRPLPPATLHLHSLAHAHLTSRIPATLDSLAATTSQLLGVHADLSTGEPAIRDEMARLTAVREVCVGVADKMAECVTRGEERCRELEARGEPGVDEIVCSTSIVHNQ